jgi:TolB-like protein/DNA-binding winged helix-turn-helix (wHTH) protein
MAIRVNKRYLLRDYQLEPDKRLLSRAGEPQHLASRPFQVLLYLIENRDRFVSRVELLDRFWQGKDVYEVTLTKCVGAIRKALNDSSDSPQFIETRYSEGYRYIGPSEEQIAQGEPSTIEIERTRGVKIVVEEEEIQNGLPAGEHVVAVRSPAGSRRSARRQRFRLAAALAVVLAAVTLTTITLIFFSSSEKLPRTQPSPIRSIAVLPLKNLTGDPSQEYFSDGVTESLISELAKINGLKVISRGSVFTFKDKEADPREVGKRLGVMAVLEGSVRKNGDTVRVEVRLASAEDGRVLWVGDSSNRALKDILAVQDEIGCSVAAELRLRLCGEGETQRRYTDNVEAYQAYLKGSYFLNKRTPDGIRKAIEHFQRAIEIDPNYALAYAWLAFSCQNAIWFMNLPPSELIERARVAARRALEIDETLAEAHIAMAVASFSDWDLSNTIRETGLAIKLNPGSAAAHHANAYALMMVGRPDEAIAEVRTALELDPLDVVMNVDLGEILLYARHYDEAIAALKTAIEMDSTRVNAHSDLATAYEQKGMYTEAFAEEVKAEELAGASPEAIAALKEAYASSGMSGFWHKRLVLYKQRSEQSYFPPFILAAAYARIGEEDQALACLMRAYAEHSPLLMDIGVRPEFDGLRSDPRFGDLLRRVGLPD